MSVQFTTDLPDATAPTLGNGVEDEIAVETDDVINYGDYRIQAKETTESSWPGATPNSEVTVGADSDLSGTVAATITNREDGEAYDVRVRTETEHTTGAWTSPVEITTKFPGAASPVVDTVGQTSVTISWTDNSDNEDGFRLQRRKRIGGQFGAWQTVTTVGLNTTSATDDTVQPGRTYEFRIQAYTEDAVANSSAVQTTTDNSGVRQRQVPSSGWYVEVDHSDGTTVTPRLRGDPQVEQQVNGLPQLTIPVPRDTKWQAEGFEDAPVRAWRDGVPQPVDTLVDVEVSEGETTLIAEGGAALKTRVQKSVQFADAHVVAEDLVQANTPYEVNVDDPADSVEEVLMQSADSESEWESILAAYPFPSDDPRYVTSGGALDTHPTALYAEGETPDRTDWETFFAGRFSNGAASREAGIGNQISWTLSPDYTIPAGSVGVAVRFGYQGTTHPGVSVTLEGTEVLAFGADVDVLGGGDQRWITQTSSPGGDVAGDVTLEIDITGAASDGSYIYVDAVTVYDQRFTEAVTDDDLTSGGLLSWPHLHPSGLQSETVDADALNQVVGGRATVTVDDPNGLAELALSNDQGGSYPISATDTTSVDGAFSSSSGQIRARLTQSYYDSGSGPVEFDAGQTVDVLEVYSDQEETPVLIDRSFDGRLVDVLRQIAEDKNSVWELRRDRDGFSFEWAQLGQRSSDADPSVANYQVSKNTGDVVERAVIKGGRQRRRGEAVTADHGTWVSLSEDDLVTGAEAVYDPSDGTQYERGSDYEVDYLGGELQTLASGSISDGASLELDYQYKPVASYTATGVSDPKTIVRSLPAIQSEQTCEQVAFYLVSQFGSPIYTATITIPDSAGWSVIDEVNPSQIPTAGVALETKRIETTPEATVIQAGTQAGLDEAISRIQQRLAATEDKV